MNYCIVCNKNISKNAKKCKSCVKLGHKSGRTGKKHSEKTKKKISRLSTGKLNSFYGRKHKKESKNKILSTQIIRWKNRVSFKQNKCEKKLEEILNSLFGRDYRFVGNGKFWIDGFNPDFININGQKSIIELYGRYWHNLPDYKKRDKRRIKSYKKYGYRTLIIWDIELKNINKLSSKLIKFNNLGNKIWRN